MKQPSNARFAVTDHPDPIDTYPINIAFSYCSPEIIEFLASYVPDDILVEIHAAVPPISNALKKHNYRIPTETLQTLFGILSGMSKGDLS